MTPGEPSNGWTFSTLLTYVRALIDASEEKSRLLIEANDRRADQRFEMQQAALKAALDSSDRRLEGMNEFRKTVDDQQRLFLPRAVAETKWTAQDEKTLYILARLERLDGQKSGVSAVWLVILGAFGLIGTVLAILARMP